ncbi:M23 family metallopeptidase [Candidatus Uhrbacteria bacterium]|nr:M23 family metallopeptidase [Candidatus Uhrbacteria bacterium]
MRYLIVSLFLVGVGCSSASSVIPSGVDSEVEESQVDAETEVVLPVDGQIIYKGFGEYFEDRFSGYHVAIDFEAPADTPVYAVYDGEVVYSGWVSGYGGVMVIRSILSGRTQSYIYGHLDPSSMRAAGDQVLTGDQIAVLGEEGEETDGEREHLHFAMYEGEDVRLKGYEISEEGVEHWLNPYDYARPDKIGRASSDLIYDGREVFPIEFTVPAGWDVEYIPSIQSHNLYSLSGEGTARERSQMLVRYFDASSFLTLSTVTIHSTEDLVVGNGDYIARRYDIEKNEDVADFVDQPSWRNARHIVTDFRATDGYTRYYVVAANPELDPSVYEEVLASMKIE